MDILISQDHPKGYTMTTGNYEFRATGELLRLLNALKDESGIPMSESIRRGVVLYSIAKEEAEKGAKLVFMQNGEIVGEVENI